MTITPDRATANPTTDHFICAFAVSILFGSPKESMYCSPAITNEITVTIPSTVSIQLRKVARTQSTGPEKQMAGNENILPKEVEELPVERPTPVGTQVPPSRLVPDGHETGPLPEPRPGPEPVPTPVKGGVPLELGPLPDVEGPEGEPVPGVPSDSEGEPESVPNQSQEEPVSESLGPLPEAAPGPPVSESLGPLPEESLGPLPGEYAGEQLKAHTMKPEPDAQDELPGKAIGLQKRDTSNASRSS